MLVWVCWGGWKVISCECVCGGCWLSLVVCGWEFVGEWVWLGWWVYFYVMYGWDARQNKIKGSVSNYFNFIVFIYFFFYCFFYVFIYLLDFFLTSGILRFIPECLRKIPRIFYLYLLIYPSTITCSSSSSSSSSCSSLFFLFLLSLSLLLSSYSSSSFCLSFKNIHQLDIVNEPNYCT